MPYTNPLGLKKPSVGWSRYRDANPAPTNPLTDDIATAPPGLVKYSNAFSSLFTMLPPEDIAAQFEDWLG